MRPLSKALYYVNQKISKEIQVKNGSSARYENISVNFLRTYAIKN